MEEDEELTNNDEGSVSTRVLLASSFELRLVEFVMILGVNVPLVLRLLDERDVKSNEFLVVAQVNAVVIVVVCLSLHNGDVP